MKKLSLESRVTALESILLEKRIEKLEKMLNERVIGKMPKYFYHGTSTRAAELILKNGLTPVNVRKGAALHRLTNKNKVYLCINERIAKSWASMVNRSDYVVLRIDSRYLDPNKLTGDYNALIDPFAYDDVDDEDGENSDYDVEPEILDRYDNPRFDDENELLADYEYEGSIPPEAIEVVYRTNASLIEEIKDALEKHDVKKCIANWDKWKDADMGSDSFIELFAYYLSSAAGDPPNWENKNLQKILLSMPSDILNTEVKGAFGNTTTVLMEALNIHGGDYVQEILEAFTDKKGISDTNIELLWKKYTKPWQLKNIERLALLPERILQIGKPYIAKKYYAQLGI